MHPLRCLSEKLKTQLIEHLRAAEQNCNNISQFPTAPDGALHREVGLHHVTVRPLGRGRDRPRQGGEQGGQGNLVRSGGRAQGGRRLYRTTLSWLA